MRTRFLIVDDSELVRKSLRTVLQANPEWEICGEASDGESGVALFKELQPNIVILDFQMPGINGIETARRMSEIAPAVPIVVASSVPGVTFMAGRPPKVWIAGRPSRGAGRWHPQGESLRLIAGSPRIVTCGTLIVVSPDERFLS